MLALLSFLGAFAAGYFAEVWSIEHTTAVTNLPISHARMKKRVKKALWWTFLLGALGHADFLGAFQFHLPYLWLYLGGTAGELLGTRSILWKKHYKKVAALGVAALRKRIREKEGVAGSPSSFTSGE